MAHFQERRTGDRRQYKGVDRRKSMDRRAATSGDLECIDRARFKAWMSMTDKHSAE